MYGKYRVSGGGRPVEYIVNNGSNSMWARFFQNGFESRFREAFGSTLGSIFEVFGGRGPIFEVFEHSENHVKS